MTEAIPLNSLGFHFTDGWHFARRGMNGDVLLYRTGPMQSHADLMLTIDAKSWASIVASVSAEGETSARYQAALSYHNGEIDV